MKVNLRTSSTRESMVQILHPQQLLNKSNLLMDRAVKFIPKHSDDNKRDRR